MMFCIQRKTNADVGRIQERSEQSAIGARHSTSASMIPLVDYAAARLTHPTRNQQQPPPEAIQQQLQRLHCQNLNLKTQDFTGQWVVEIHTHLVVVKALHHARQLGIGGVVEDHQQAFG
jgi:hypothetical protein